MSALRVLHVDDEPDIRELVEISLLMDNDLSVRSCSSGNEALTAAAEWSPDIILMDVMMPVMDGPQTLNHLRENQATAQIPVVFMTARAQTRELAHFLSLGAAGVIPKPFDPISLAGTVRHYLTGGPNGLDALKAKFVLRARNDAATLAALSADAAGDLKPVSRRIGQIAHALAGSAGIHRFDAVATAAGRLEQAAEDLAEADGKGGTVESAIDDLVEAIAQECRDPGDNSPGRARTH